LLFSPLALTLTASPAIGQQATPQWIWTTPDAATEAAAGRAYFRRELTVGEGADGELEIACDDGFSLFVNGRLIVRGDDWQVRHRLPLQGLLKDGVNTIAVEAANLEGSAGLAVRIEIKRAGKSVAYSSDARWRTAAKPTAGWKQAKFDDKSWKPAAVLGPFGETAPWGALTRVVAVKTEQARPSGRRNPFRFESNDRVVLIGDAFLERMQYGYLETVLTSRLPQLQLTFRNLGWSGDTVQGIARAVFGSPEDGYQRLIKDLRDTEPTVILFCYGGNEAHDGERGMAAFQAQLNRLLDDLSGTGAAIVMLSPTLHEPSRGYKDPSGYNLKLAQYADLLRDVSTDRGLPFIDLISDHETGWKSNGVHYTKAGYWKLAGRLADKLGAVESDWEVEVDAAAKTAHAEGALVGNLKTTSTGAAFSVLDRQLPYPNPPVEARTPLRRGTIRVQGLAAGKYELQIGEQPIYTATAAQWARGVQLTDRGGGGQSAELHRLVQEKSTLFFHRYRPQNETYLFLFRKHEQGNNAVEIPQFDPLIAAAEQRVFQLARPQPRSFQLTRLPQTTRE
jgi:lysophospholipase L1-like esterase